MRRTADIERELHEDPGCRLVRADGSAWRIDGLIFTRHGLKVRGERMGPGGAFGDRLDGVYLEAGDRLEWVDGDGDVVRTHHGPVDGG